MKQLKQQLHKKFGGIHIVFAGDMRQLEPVGRYKKPIYSENVPEFRDWVNSYIELDGTHRFKQDPGWGAQLLRLRDGNATINDIQVINDRIEASKSYIPENVRYATFFNRDRDSINTALFDERVFQYYKEYGNTNGFIMIFSDNIQVKDSSNNYIAFKRKKLFWEQCGEDDIVMPQGRGRMDPVLKLYIGCRILLPTNTSVSSGLANGTQATIQKIILKPNEITHYVNLDNNVPIMAVFASQVASVILYHCNTRVHLQTFSVQPKTHTFKANLPKPRILVQDNKYRTGLVKMKATQIPILVNNATTGHKLQGSGVEELFVHNWSYVTNWVYGML